jgi:hypothetical protein
VLHTEVSAAAAARETARRLTACGLRLRPRALHGNTRQYIKDEDAWLALVMAPTTTSTAPPPCKTCTRDTLCSSEPSTALRRRCPVLEVVVRRRVETARAAGKSIPGSAMPETLSEWPSKERLLSFFHARNINPVFLLINC